MEKFELFDRLIHEFHYSNFKSKLTGFAYLLCMAEYYKRKHEEIIIFLDELSNAVSSRQTLANEQWRDRSRQWADAWYQGREYLNPFRKND